MNRCPCSYGICDECEMDGEFEPRQEKDFEKNQKFYLQTEQSVIEYKCTKQANKNKTNQSS